MVWSPGIIAGFIIIIGTVFALIKQYETRFVLIVSGVLMCLCSPEYIRIFSENSFGVAILQTVNAILGAVNSGFDAFSDRMVSKGLVTVILTVMGFAAVMKLTKCDAHLVNLMVGILSKARPFLIPGTVIVTAFINISLSSAAGCAAAVGAVLIPLMISIGVRPAMAAAAVMAGTFGSQFSPGLSHNVFVANILTEQGVPTSVMDIISTHAVADIVSILIAAIGLSIIASIRGEGRGYVADQAHSVPKLDKVNILYAMMPILPVVLLVVSAFCSSSLAGEAGKWFVETVPYFKNLSVPNAMIIGAIIGIAVTWTNPEQATKDFFAGMGTSYANVMGIIIAAAVFVAGMSSVGLVQTLTNYMKNTPEIAVWAASIGPFFLAVMTGSGDAATMAFNEAITPHAADFGMSIGGMGSIATLAGCLGRTMSPLAGAAIVCAGIANINPIEITKRLAIPMLVALIAITFLLK